MSTVFLIFPRFFRGNFLKKSKRGKPRCQRQSRCVPPAPLKNFHTNIRQTKRGSLCLVFLFVAKAGMSADRRIDTAESPQARPRPCGLHDSCFASVKIRSTKKTTDGNLSGCTLLTKKLVRKGEKILNSVYHEHIFFFDSVHVSFRGKRCLSRKMNVSDIENFFNRILMKLYVFNF